MSAWLRLNRDLRGWTRKLRPSAKQAEKDSVEDEARIKASIETERQRIVEAVSQRYRRCRQVPPQRDLKRFAAGLAVDRAAQRMVLSEDDDRALVQEFSQSLEPASPERRQKLMSAFAARYARAFADVVVGREVGPRRSRSSSSMILPRPSPAVRI